MLDRVLVTHNFKIVIPSPMNLSENEAYGFLESLFLVG
jgi:hypothetical protein